MGCTLFDMDVFRKIEPPWFVTHNDLEHGSFTQDLAFYNAARKQSVELAVGVDCRVKVGHLDVTTGEVW